MTPLQTLNQHYAAALARFAPNRIAFGVEERPITFAQLSEDVARLAAALRHEGVAAGSVVGYTLPNCAEVIALVLALSGLGARVVPLFPMIPEATRAGIFTSFGCSLVIATGPAVAGLTQAAERMGSRMRVVELSSLSEHRGEANAADAARAVQSDSPNQPLLAAASSGTTGAPSPFG